LSKRRIIKILKGLGLSNNDAKVYIILAKHGPLKSREIASLSNLEEDCVHRSLKELQEIDIIKASIQNPLEFIAVPFEEVIDLFIEVKKEQAKKMEETKKELISSWKTITE
jgi:sugar-specific transcriptional regulator TrmB